MVDFDEFKNAFPKDLNLTDEEIQNLNVRAEKIAQMLFDIWTDKLCKESKNEANACKECRKTRISH